MPVTFQGTAIFGSGPARVSEGPRGSAILVKSRVSPFDPGTQAIGPLEVNVIVRGRVSGANEAALWSALDDVFTVLTSPPTAGTLADGRGRTWSDMSFVGFDVADRVDRGHVVSTAFEARFVRFLT